jgi:HEAT repeats
MTTSRVFRTARAACLRAATITALLVGLTRGTPARADNVSDLVQQLATASSDKVRLSAALNLTKLADPRAILPLVKALGNDSDETVRGAAAVGLGELVDAKTKSSIKNLAVSTLKTAAASDSSSLVRDQAAQALKAIGVTAPTPVQPPSSASGGGASAIYVNLGPMSSKTGNTALNAKLKALMVKVATKTMGKVASGMATTWPGGGAPTQAQLQAKSTQGFYVDGTTNELNVKQSGSSATISCKISMLLASFPDKSIFGLLNGGASVQASSSASEIALASEDCVSAVVEDLIAKKIVPTICSKVGCP